MDGITFDFGPKAGRGTPFLKVHNQFSLAKPRFILCTHAVHGILIVKPFCNVWCQKELSPEPFFWAENLGVDPNQIPSLMSC